MSQSIKVDIYGQVYPINAELDEAYIRKIAAYVDEKMRLISDAARTVDTQKVAGGAAFAVAQRMPRAAGESGGRGEIMEGTAGRSPSAGGAVVRRTGKP